VALAADQVEYRKAASIGNDGFAVDQERTGSQCRHGGHSERKPGREIVALTGDEADTGTVTVRHDAEAVMLDLGRQMALPWDNNSWEVAAKIAATRGAAFITGESRPETPLPLRDAADKAQLLLQAVVVPGERTDEGKIIEAVTIPWFDIIAMLARDPNVAFEIPPEKWEEIIAGAYRRAGSERVILTPRSGDHGRDVIATKHGLGFVRIIDQVKAFKPSHPVTADESSHRRTVAVRLERADTDRCGRRCSGNAGAP
jgi:hypothetical protein